MSFISKISFGLYVNHVVWGRDLRIQKALDNHWSYFGMDDLPRNHLWTFLDVMENYLIFIPMSYLTEKYIEQPFNKIGNELANKVPRNFEIPIRKVLIVATALLLGAISFISIYLHSPHKENYTPLKIRLSSDLLKG